MIVFGIHEGGKDMKKYFTADVLSLTEIVMGLTLIVMTILGTPADVVIWVFIAGQ